MRFLARIGPGHGGNPARSTVTSLGPPEVFRRKTDIQIHTEKVLRAILDAVLNLQGGLEAFQLKVRRTGVGKLNSSNLTLANQSEAHLSSQLPFIHLLQSIRRNGYQGCCARSGTNGDESGGHGLVHSGAVDTGRRLDICVCGRHPARTRDKSGSDQEHRRDVPSSFFGSCLSGKCRAPIGAPRKPGFHVRLLENAKARSTTRLGAAARRAESHSLGFN